MVSKCRGAVLSKASAEEFSWVEDYLRNHENVSEEGLFYVKGKERDYRIRLTFDRDPMFNGLFVRMNVPLDLNLKKIIERDSEDLAKLCVARRLSELDRVYLKKDPHNKTGFVLGCEFDCAEEIEPVISAVVRYDTIIHSDEFWKFSNEFRNYLENKTKEFVEPFAEI